MNLNLTETTSKMHQLLPIVFDLDGTLYKTHSSFLPAVGGFLSQFGIDQVDEKLLLNMIGEPPTFFSDWLKSLDTVASLSELKVEFHRRELEAIREMGQLYPGVSDILREFHLSGHKLFICSNGSKDYVDTVIDRFSLNTCFSEIYVPQSKDDTKAVMLHRLCVEHQIDCGLMVGDRYHDMTAARAVNFKAIGAAYGYGGDEIDNADIVINDLSELREIVK